MKISSFNAPIVFANTNQFYDSTPLKILLTTNSTIGN